MRADAVAPRTWMLAAVAGWAVLVWLLALFGLGGRIAPLAADPSLAADLPQPRAAVAPRVGPFGQYAQIAARPVFNQDRQPRPFFIEGQEEGQSAQPFDYVLTSVLITPGMKMAIVQPSQGGQSLRLKVGESPEDNPAWRLAEVKPRSAVFEGPEGQRTLDLRVYAGGGEAPTPVQAAPIAEAPAAAASPAPRAAPPVIPSSPAAAPVKGGDPEQQQTASMTPEQQMDAIRKRIEARRAQLRLQDEQDLKRSKNKKR